MTRHAALGLLDRAILDAFDLLDARPDRPHLKTQRVLDAVYEATGIGPRLSYEPLCTLARPWVLHLLLVDFHGNVGSPDYGPAAAPYTESRLTALGMAALVADRAHAPLTAVALVNGDLHVGGTRPPLDPLRTLTALRAAADGATDAEVTALVGSPAFPSGCEVQIDLGDFVAGRETTLIATGVLRHDGERSVVSNLPPDCSSSELAVAIQQRVTWSGPPHRGPAVPPIVDLYDSSTPTETHLDLVTRPGTAPDELARFLATLWHFRRSVKVGLGVPLAHLVREAAGRVTSEQLALMKAAVRSG